MLVQLLPGVPKEFVALNAQSSSVMYARTSSSSHLAATG